MEFPFDVILYSKLGNESSVSGNFKCSRGPQVAHPALNNRRLHPLSILLPITYQGMSH